MITAKEMRDIASKVGKYKKYLEKAEKEIKDKAYNSEYNYELTLQDKDVIDYVAHKLEEAGFKTIVHSHIDKYLKQRPYYQFDTIIQDVEERINHTLYVSWKEERKD